MGTIRERKIKYMTTDETKIPSEETDEELEDETDSSLTGGNEGNSLNSDQYRAFQSKVDSLTSEKEKLEEKLKSKMDMDEQEKYELQEELKRTREQLDQKEVELNNTYKKTKELEMSDVRKRLINEKFPMLKQWEQNFVGNTEEELKQQMQSAAKELKDWSKNYLSTEEGKKFIKDEPVKGMGSEKTGISGDVGDITPEAFKRLSLKDKQKVLKERGILK